MSSIEKRKDIYVKSVGFGFIFVVPRDARHAVQLFTDFTDTLACKIVDRLLSVAAD